LGHLIDKSLVLVERSAQGGAARYRLLETIRQYALAKLAVSGEADEVRRRHAVYYLTLAEASISSSPASSPLRPTWLESMELEHDNLSAALAWSQWATGGFELGLRLARALDWFWFAEGYWSESRGWLESTLAHKEAANYPRERAQALESLGDILALQGDYAAAQSRFADSLNLFQELEDRPMIAWLLNRLGWLAREHGDAATARLRLEESLALYRELEDKAGIAWSSVTLGEVMVMQEDTARATVLIEEALPLFRQLEDTFGISWALNHLGHVAQLRGEYEHAARLHEESLPLFRQLGARNFGIAWAYQSLGETALAQSNAALATTHYMKALPLFNEVGDRMGMAWCLAGLAGVAAVNGNPERAAWLWSAAEALRQSIGAREAPASRATRERLMV
jgi:tetratricopeptide (TPR) repeat protein